MSEHRRVPVVTPNGTKLILVIDGSYIEGMEEGFLKETVPMKAIVAVEPCPDDVMPEVAAGWKPE